MPDTDSTTEKALPPLPPGGRVFPFFVPALLFLSFVFSVFAPLPLLLFFIRSGWKRFFLGLLSNGIIVWLAGGWDSALMYVLFVAIPAVFIPVFLVERRYPMERSILLVLGLMAVAAGGAVLALSWAQGLPPLEMITTKVSELVDQLQVMSGGKVTEGDIPLEVLKRRVLVESPSALGVFSLVAVWANLILLLKINPGGLRQRLGIDPSFYKTWKAPEFLVWPTLLTGATLLFDGGWVSDVGFNIFKFLMAIYAIQGMSILSFVFDSWKVRGIFRVLIFVLLALTMMPLLLALGFFDLWFDFRKKIRQT